jgi:iron complex outermembrane receptor protein
MNIQQLRKRVLEAGAAVPVMVLLGAGLATPAVAQDAATAVDTAEGDEPVILVTGSIFRGTTAATAAPVTVLSEETLDQRGLSTVQEGIQTLSSNNGPALTNSFSANGAFAAGASAVSLRGLSTNSTLVLFDGQRAAYYPLADDGSRNFVDLNTIPDEIIERVEVLREGASSTYGADAIAGVVNIITKREFQGVGGRFESGVSQDGNAANQRLSAIVGTGDLGENGMNAYLSGFYYRSEGVKNSDLPYPFNTDDETGICYEGNCGPNGIVNSRDPLTGQLQGFQIGYDTYVRPYTGANTAIEGSRFELLNPAAGCQYGPGYNLTPEEIGLVDSDGDLVNATAPVNSQVCTVDITNRFGVVTPDIQRFGGSGRVTALVGDDAEAYFMVNFQQSRVSYTGFPPVFRGQANAGIDFPPFSSASGPSASLAPGSFALSLPVYVCPTGVGDASGLNTGCTVNTPGAVLNPNNPFAAQGQIARIIGRPIQQPTENETRSRVYRAAFGLNGTFAEDWQYTIDATAMHNDLRRQQNGYVYIANMLTAVAQGTYNFVDPSQNSQDVLDFISPDNITDASSDLYAIQGTLGTSVTDLPGGPLYVGAGAQIRYEAVDAPSANPDTNGPTERFFTLNAFGTTGDRTVYSAFGEINAPVLDVLEFNASGRYDKYSSGQEAFSPKISALFQPIDQIAIRGTYSEGFRIPSFGEANALPTTGYVTVATSTLPADFLAQYSIPGNPNGACAPDNPDGCPAYITTYSRGSTTVATPDLDPERSRSYTVGVVANPLPALRLTVDYFNIEKKDAIANASISPALAAYFAGQAIPEGFNVIPDAPDPNFPNALPRPAFVESPLVNANTINVEGLDFAALVNLEFGDIRFTSSAEASYIINLSTTFQDGTTESYEGTLGNFALTAGSGTPEWKGTWQNTIEFDPVTLTGTVNYYGGYDLSAEDETGPGTAGQCGLSPGFVPCEVDAYITLDMVAQVRAGDDVTFYVNVLNVLDDLPPIDPVTYGAHLYNPVQGANGIFGRSFRAGVRFGF